MLCHQSLDILQFLLLLTDVLHNEGKLGSLLAQLSAEFSFPNAQLFQKSFRLLCKRTKHDVRYRSISGSVYFPSAPSDPICLSSKAYGKPRKPPTISIFVFPLHFPPILLPWVSEHRRNTQRVGTLMATEELELKTRNPSILTQNPTSGQKGRKVTEPEKNLDLPSFLSHFSLSVTERLGEVGVFLGKALLQKTQLFFFLSKPPVQT